MVEKRLNFERWAKRVDPSRLVFLDEAGANLTMGRSHAWIQRGLELIERRPMNWGKNLTMIGAIRRDGWLTLGTIWNAANSDKFVQWVRVGLAPKLRPGDIVVMDNVAAHKDPRVSSLIRQRRARVKFLPPYSPDFNPIEPGWALVKKHIKRAAPRTASALRRCVHHARRFVRPRHCEHWYTHSGYKRCRSK